MEGRSYPLNYVGNNNNSPANNIHYQQQQQSQQQLIYGGGGLEGAAGKTTVFLPDGGHVFVDGGSASTSRVYVNAPTSSSMRTITATQVQHPGHHRDKLDIIRDSLKPFEQHDDATALAAYYYDNHQNYNNGTADARYGLTREPPEEIQRMMIHALTQIGYDKESAYYALKLVNFNSVMDAAKVLSSIKQNLQSTYDESLQQSVYSTPSTMDAGYDIYSDVKPMDSGINGISGNGFAAQFTASTLSSDARAALSRYGVTMPGDETCNFSIAPGTATTINLDNKGNTVFSSKLYFNNSIVSQQQSPRKAGANYTNTIVTSPLITQNSKQIMVENSNGNIVNNNYIASEKANREAGDYEQFQNPHSKSRITQTKTYQCSYTQEPHTVLRHSSSFDPADKNNWPTLSKRLLAKQQTPQSNEQQQRGPTRIERNASERIQPTTSLAPKYTFPDSRPSNGQSMCGIVVEKIPQEQDPIVEPQRCAIAQLKIRPCTNGAESIGLSPATKSRKSATEFSAETPNVRTIYVDPDELNLGSKEIVNNPPAYGNHVDQSNRYAVSPARVPKLEGRISPLTSVDTQPFQQSCTSQHSMDSQQPPVQRCVSPLPQSVARRLRADTYEPHVRPCKSGMFRFFMEQHIEKLIQQYRERNQRAIQLTKEMELAKLADTMQEQMVRLLRQKESKYIRLKRQRMNKNMFDMIRHIGVGAFGKVTLVRKKDTGQIYAMKTLSKEDVIQKQQAAHVKAERDILAEANSNWIVKLFFSFQDAKNLYFIMEYVPGGDMMQLLINKGIFSEKLARFYIAELICAIEYVHSLGFIHRDIKPDNILIDQKGHIKLTDFGLCTGLRWTHDKRHYVIYDDDVPRLTGGSEVGMGPHHLREDSFTLPLHLAAARGKGVKLLEHRHHQRRNQAHSVVGTGNYMAPEVIKKTGHTQLCDWWSVGVILYEMVYGRPPFMSHNENPAETQYMIVNWRRFLDLDNPMGARLSSHCVDMIARLCCDEQARLGRAGAREIKTHSWFRNINFAELRSQPAEYVPTVAHAEDTSNFDTFEVNAEELFMTLRANGTRANGTNAGNPCPLGPNGQPYNPAFFDFTFRHFFASDGAHGGEHVGGHAFGRAPTQQRPSLAPLIEAAAAQQQKMELTESKESRELAVKESYRNPAIDEVEHYKEPEHTEDKSKFTGPANTVGKCVSGTTTISITQQSSLYLEPKTFKKTPAPSAPKLDSNL